MLGQAYQFKSQKPKVPQVGIIISGNELLGFPNGEADSGIMCWQCSEHRTDALEGQRHGPGSGEELADWVDDSSCEAGLERSQSCKHLEHLD